ncbi:hypothetical protein RND81_09G231900 [Saponaria officinalis]|uniref:F-box protein n=1 Tax=Saponaria officinalis TaxID=3572 RepID=A0AAW1IPG1_SAPOF
MADDVLAIIGRFLPTVDICNLSMCCKSLNVVAQFDKIWLTKCEELGILSSADLVVWRKAFSSYKALCRFLTSIEPLLGIWVHLNPELGNVVYVMPGFASVVGCRVIPQKVGPFGIEGSPLLWAPVFEVISDDNGALSFILHGKVKDQDYIYSGIVKSVEKTCDVLLLEIEHREKNGARFEHSKSLHRRSDEETGKIIDHISVTVQFSELSFDDKKKLFETVTSSLRIQYPESSCASLFPCLRDDEDKFLKDVSLLSERRRMLIEMGKIDGGYIDLTASHMQLLLLDQIDLSEMNSLSSGENEDTELHDFLRAGDAIGLTFQASSKDLSYYRSTWPSMDQHQLALYKLPIQEPTVGHEFAGLWGGSYGWPPGKPGKAFFLLNLSYCVKWPRKKRLIANKLIEGTDYAFSPNGSAMFIVKVNVPSTDPFPCTSGADSLPVSVREAFAGKGIGGGYGFRYPGFKPGSLFVLQDDVLAFVWGEPQFILTLQRLNLEALLKKGQRVPALSPINNFAYLTRSYENVFAGSQT